MNFYYRYPVAKMDWNKLYIPNLSQSPDIGQNFDEDVFNFWISGQIPYKKKLS